MSKTRLTGLSLSGFRSIKDKVEISLPATGLILLRGVNKHTGGGSGTGKTNLVLGITHATGRCPLPATELLNWDSKSYEVSVGLQNERGDAIVRRSSKGSSFVLDGADEVTGRATDPALEAYMGLSTDMIGLLTYRQQREGGVFIGMKDSSKKEFLTKLLNLDRFEAASETSKETLKSIETLLIVRKSGYEIFVATLEAEKAKPILPLPTFDLGAHNRLHHNLSTQIEDYGNSIKEMEAALEKTQLEISEKSTAIKHKYVLLIKSEFYDIPFNDIVDKTKLNQISEKLKLLKTKKAHLEADDEQAAFHTKEQRRELEEERNKCRKTLDSYPYLHEKLETARANLRSLLSSTCPTCSQAWVRQESDRKILEAKIKDLELQAADEPAVKKKLIDILAKIEVLVHTPDPMLAKVSEIESKLNADFAAENALISQVLKVRKAEDNALEAQSRAKIAELQVKRDSEIAVLVESEKLTQKRQVIESHRHDLSGLRLALSDVEGAIKNFNTEVKHINAANQAREESLAKIRKDLELRMAEIRDLEIALAEEQDFIVLVKDFLGLIFDEVLAEISDEANRILGQVPNTNHMTIGFVSEVVNGKGETKKEIRTIVRIGDKETTPKAGCSGGQYGVVELATDLALGEIIARRTGVSPGWLILDEALDGLGRVEKEACLEMLQEFARERLVLVIDHDTSFKEMFSTTMDVEFQDGVTVVKQ